MSIGWVWGLVGTLGFFAFTLILEVVKLSRSLKSSDDELASARQKITTLDEKHNEAITDLKKFHQGEMEELRKTIDGMSQKNTPSRPNFGFVENGDLKWKVHLVNGTVYSIEDAPYCVIHDLQLLHFKGGYVCSHVHEDGCESRLKDTDYDFRKTYIETLAERQFRQPEKV